MKSINDLLNLNEKQAVSYNFASEGEEADRSVLAKKVYNSLFWFYDNKEFYRQAFEWFGRKKGYEDLTGDTAITWRTVIMKKYYKRAYRNLTEEQHDEIKSILKKYSQFDGPVEFVDKDTEGKDFMQLSNYYVLGNLVLNPTWGGINPKRAAYLNDCYDDFLNLVKKFYEESNKNSFNNDGLELAILEQKDYFGMFKTFNNFIDSNLLQDFTDGYDDQGNYNIKDLSDAETFEDYVKASVSVINARSKRMWDKLQENNSK